MLLRNDHSIRHVLLNDKRIPRSWVWIIEGLRPDRFTLPILSEIMSGQTRSVTVGRLQQSLPQQHLKHIRG